MTTPTFHAVPDPDQPNEPTNPYDVGPLQADVTESILVERRMTTIAVRKPGKNEFFRVNPHPDYIRDWWTLVRESGMDREVYWVAPGLQQKLPEHVQPTRIFTCISRRKALFLWPAKLATADTTGSARTWYSSALKVAEDAKTNWVRLVGNKDAGAYESFIARGDLDPPEWPKTTFLELTELAFRDRLIDSLDHVVLRELDGKI